MENKLGVENKFLIGLMFLLAISIILNLVFSTQKALDRIEEKEEEGRLYSGPTQTKIAEYSKETLDKIEKCNKYAGDICINKTIICPIKVKNIDIKEGVFEIKFKILEGTREVNAQSISISLKPNEEKAMQAEFRAINDTENHAEKNLLCDYEILAPQINV
jgi:hypothetical protein